MMHERHPFTRHGGEDRREPDVATGLLRVGGAFAFAFLIASGLPPALVPVALSQLLTVAAFAIGTIALLAQDKIFAPTLTRWDEAAMLLALALVAGLFVDDNAARAAMDGLAAGIDTREATL